MKRVLIANRGEIAVRILRSCKALGLETVAIFSEADRGALHARLADRAVCVGPARARESYLNADAIVTAALGTGSDAVHPGYGFLAENAGFARLCEENGLTFLGPRPEAIERMGNKIEARKTADALGVPVIPGSRGRIASGDELASRAAEIGFPLLLKAAAGGGGRGMRVVRTAAELDRAFSEAEAEAYAAFGDGALYAERFLENVRHIEIQVVADGRGAFVHLGERDCSVQRRSQKLLEESPAVIVSRERRDEMAEAALAIARHIDYRSLGTLEFVFEPATDRFYFLEMNTRIQVEHPVTEMVTGLDLVGEQLRIGAGEPLRFSQHDVRLIGHAIECRINAERAEEGFKPSPGRIDRWEPPQSVDVRVDSHCFAGCVVPPFYDSLLAKVIAWGRDREAVIERMRAALADFTVAGVATTIDFHRFLLDDPAFVANMTHTRWVDERVWAGSAT